MKQGRMNEKKKTIKERREDTRTNKEDAKKEKATVKNDLRKPIGKRVLKRKEKSR